MNDQQTPETQPTSTQPVSQPSQQPTQQPQTSTKNKWLVPVIILLLLGTTAFFAYQYYLLKQQTSPKQPPTLPTSTLQPSTTSNQIVPTPASDTSSPTIDPTANWETYSDSNYQFLFKYPANWEVRDALPTNKDFPSHKDKVVFLGLAPITTKEDFLGSISLTTKPESEIISELKTFPEGAPNHLVSETKKNFLSYSATEIITENTLAQVKSKAIVFTRDNITYVLNGGGTKDTTIIDQILSTFQFTN